jgi:Peptidase M15/Bacterial SH3 domain
MRKAILRVMWLVCLMTGSKADQGLLSGQDISDLVAGASVEIDTPIGTKLPVRYAPDGHLSGRAGPLAFYLGASTDGGRWWINMDQLCHRWNTWFNSEPQCFRLKKEGRRIRWWTQHGTSGTAVISETAQLPRTPSDSASPPTPPQSTPVTVPAAARPDKPLRSSQATTLQMGVVEPAPAPAPDAAAPSPKTKLAAPSPPEPKRPADPTYMVANVERDDVLNVRSGPSTEFDVIAELAPDTRGVSIIGACRAGWCPVQHHIASGWVNRNYLAPDAPPAVAHARHEVLPDAGATEPQGGAASWRDQAEAPRHCLTYAARALLERIEAKFGPVRLISTCRAGAQITGTGRPSRHASGNAVDFDAGARKAEIVEWLIANHHAGGTMTYTDMSHIHVDIGPHFVSIAGGQHWASWRKP